MLAEVAPFLVPQFDALLVSLVALAGLLVALGTIAILHSAAKGIGGSLGWLLGEVPYVGHVLSSPVNAVVRWMDSVYAEAAQGLDKQIGRFLHSLGKLIGWLGHELRAHADLLWLLANTTLGTEFAAIVYREFGALRRALTAVERRAESWAAAHVAHVLRPVWAHIDGLYRRSVAIEHALGGWVMHDVEHLRARARALEREYLALFRRISRIDALLGTAAFAGAVAYALERLGMGWLKCRNVGKVGRGLCGFPANLLEDILAGAVDVLLISDLCVMVRAMVVGAQEFRPELDLFITGMDDLLSCRGTDRPPPLPLIARGTPPPVSAGRLAAGA